MRHIVPYNSIEDALQALDNGGRFYNLFTKANDGIIEQVEIKKVGGDFTTQKQMILFLEMSLIDLTKENQIKIVEKLDKGLQSAYEKFKFKKVTFKVADVLKSSNTIIKGIPELIDEESNFKGFISSPKTRMLIPMRDEYELYKVHDEYSSETFIIAQQKGQMKLPIKSVIIGGEIKEMLETENKNRSKSIYIEGVYYINS